MIIVMILSGRMSRMMMITPVMGLERSHLNAPSLYPLFIIGEHDISLSIFQTDFLFRASDILDFSPTSCAIHINGVYRVS